MTYSKAVAMRLSNLLIQYNMTQYRLCKNTGLERSTLQSIMRENTKDIKLSTVGLMASAFNMSLREFFNDPLFDSPNIEL